MSPPPKLASSHCIRGWHSLMYGQPSYTGQVYQSHPMQDYLLWRWWREDATRETWQGGHLTWPTSKASLGWKNGKLQLESWTSTRASTEDGWRPQVKWFGCRPPEEHICEAEGWCLCLLMLADSEPKEECYHSLNWVMAGKANQKKGGGSEMGKQPMCQGEGPKVYHFNTKCSNLLRGTNTNCGGITSYPSKQPSRNNRAKGCALQKKGGYTYRPLRNTPHLTTGGSCLNWFFGSMKICLA